MFARLGFLFDRACLAGATFLDGLGFDLVPDAFGTHVRIVRIFLVIRIEPAAAVLAGLHIKIAVDFPIRPRFKRADLFLPSDHQSQGRRLHTTNGCPLKAAVARIEGRHGAGAIDPHKPVTLRAAQSSAFERNHITPFAKASEGILDGLIGHGLHPETLNGLLHFADLLHEIEDQLSFATGITSVDDRFDVFAFHEALEEAQSVLGLLDWLEAKFVRQDGKTFEFPLSLRHFELHQVTDG